MKYKLRLGVAGLIVLLAAQNTAGATSTPIVSVPPVEFKDVSVLPAPAPTIVPVIADNFPHLRVVERKVVPTPTPKPKVKVKNTTSRLSRAEVKAYVRAKIGTKQFNCISKLWTGESGWRWNARNPESGAYGIPQAYPAGKMANKKNKGGPDWKTNPITQVNWGMNYVKERYGSACNAYRIKKSRGWY